MIDIRTGELKDLWPDEKSAEFLSLSYAIKLRIADIIVKASKIGILYDVDGLDEEVLDYIAIEMRALYYRQNMPIEMKRKIVKNLMLWYSKAGTLEAVQEIVSTVFEGESDVEEWYLNGGDPDTFEVVIPDTAAGKTGVIDDLEDVVEKTKNVRSHYRGLTFQTKDGLKLKTEDDTAYKFNFPMCGTMPYTAELGSASRQRLALGKSQMAGISKIEHPGIETGTKPYTSEGGRADAVKLRAGKADGGYIANSPLPDQTKAGTAPYNSTVGKVDTATAALKKESLLQASRALRLLNNAMAGTSPTVSEVAKVETAGIKNAKAEAPGGHPVLKPGESTRPKQ